jgi:ferritin-like metal-binding protein YciE
MDEETFQSLLGAQVGRLHAAEKAFQKMLPRLAKYVATREFKDVLKLAQAEVKEHLSRLERVNKLLGMKRAKGECAAFDALVSECMEAVDTYPEGNLRDAALLLGLEHLQVYKSLSCESIAHFAKLLGEDEVVIAVDASHQDNLLAAKRWVQIGVQVNAEAYVDHRADRSTPNA